VCWHNPRLGLLRPDTFIPMAERTGDILEIGDWVLRRACEQGVVWRASSMPDLTVNVNVSARQLDESNLVGRLAEILRSTGLPATALTLEITESALMRHPAHTLEQLTALKKLGIRLAIDDFGTGYSSLAWLQHIPADELKIDKAFIAAVDTSAEGAAIVRTVIELAHTFNMTTVADGIETSRQLRTLQQLSCDLGQGSHCAAAPIRFVGTGDSCGPSTVAKVAKRQPVRQRARSTPARIRQIEFDG
jgi:EAL domain-containing protein (putative c-di-GMP-specific phosphodiesterase class I)